MAFMTIGSSTVPVRPGGLRARLDSVGSVRRAFSGSPRTSVRARYKVWIVETVLMPIADAESLMDDLNALGTVSLSGDLLSGSTFVVDNIGITDTQNSQAGVLARVTFELWETVSA